MSVSESESELELELAWYLHYRFDTQLMNLIDDIVSV